MAQLVEHSSWMFEHTAVHDPHLSWSPDWAASHAALSTTPTEVVHTAVQALWHQSGTSSGSTSSGHLDPVLATSMHALLTGNMLTPAAPSLSVASKALIVNEGGSIALPITVSPAHAGNVSVTINGLASYETLTDALDHKVFSGSSVTLTAAEVNSGLSLASSYSGHGHPVNTLTISATDTIGHQSATSASQAIVVTDPPAPTLSPDGSAITVATGGSVTTSDGTWTFGTPVAGIGNTLLLNGVQVDGGIGMKLKVANGGVLYAENDQYQWYSFSNGAWQQSPPPSNSPDGSAITAAQGGMLSTADGTWTFGSNVVPGLGNTVLLNSFQVGGIATQLEVANGDVMYAENATGQWYSFSNGQWEASAAPASAVSVTTIAATAPSAAPISAAPPVTGSAVSPGGSAITVATGGSLTTPEGTWTFGAAVPGVGNALLLNGVQVDGGVGMKLDVANGGVLYAENDQYQWYSFSNGAWQQSPPPSILLTAR